VIFTFLFNERDLKESV